MMGTKVRMFGPLQQVSLEDLVPKDHFYRHAEHKLNLSFVRDLVRPCYAAGGRPWFSTGSRTISTGASDI